MTEKTEYEWTESDIEAISQKGNSTLSKPGGDCKALYKKTDSKQIYMRLELHEPIGIDIQYIFLVNIEPNLIYQVFVTPERVDLFEVKSDKATKIENETVKAHAELHCNNIELAIDYTGLGLGRKAAEMAVVQVVIEELGAGKVIKTDKGQFS